MANVKTVGLPRALYYFEYGEKWIKFLSFLGFKVVVSDKTDAWVLSGGIEAAPDDMCLPVKCMYGHVLSLLKNHRGLDYLFLPRVVKTGKTAYTCPKVMGVTDMLRSSALKLPTVIDCEFDGRDLPFFISVGKALGKSAREITAAARKTMSCSSAVKRASKHSGSAVVAVVAHPYILGDEFLNMGVFKLLSQAGIDCITSVDEDEQVLRKAAGNAGYKKPFWHCANRALGFTKRVVDERLADGIIFLTSYGCGTDPFTIPFCKDYVTRSGTGIPTVQIYLDEHRSAEGFRTRIEAFCDCVNAVKENCTAAKML